MSNRNLCKVWKMANSIEDDSDEDINMPEVCADLVPWIDRCQESVRKPLSLKTSSALISGAAKLYKRKAQHLYEDAQKLDKEIEYSKKFRCYSSNNFVDFIDSSLDTSSHYPTEEATDSSYDSPDLGRFDGHNQIFSYSSRSSMEPENLRVDKSTQVSDKELEEESFDEKLPYGIVTIFDSYKNMKEIRKFGCSLNYDIVKNLGTILG